MNIITTNDPSYVNMRTTNQADHSSWREAIAAIPSIPVSRIVRVEPHSTSQGRFVQLNKKIAVTPDGREQPWEIASRPNAVVSALARTSDRALVLIAGYRAPIESWHVTLPAGIVEPGQSPAKACRRELWEETGYVGHETKFLAKTPPSPGITDEDVSIYAMPNVRHSRHGGQRLEATEQIVPLIVPEHELSEFILAVMSRQDVFSLDPKILHAVTLARLMNIM